jgi:signal transduction histidine kinase
MVWLRHRKPGFDSASKGIATAEFETSINPLGLIDEILEARSLVTVGNVFTDPRIKDFELFRREGIVSFVGLPMVANGESLGSLIFLTREEHHFGEEEVGFLSTLTVRLPSPSSFSALQQISSNRLSKQTRSKMSSRRVSHELKTPLNVISGYSSMLTEGMLGEITPIQEKALQTVSRQSKELHNLIEVLR